MPSSSASWRRLNGRHFCYFIVASFTFLVALRPIDSLDYWTHLAFGREYLREWSLVIAEPFLGHVDAVPIDNTEWPFQILLYLLRSLLGDVGVSLAVALLAVAVFTPVLALCCRKDESHWYLAMAGLLVAFAYVAQFRFLPRPELLAYVLLSTTFVLTSQWARDPGWKRITAVAALFAFWIPLHITWSMGILFWMVFLLSQAEPHVWRRLWSRPGQRWCLVMIAAVAAVGVLGAGRLAWQVLVGVQEGGRMFGITEMMPVWHFPSVAWPFYLLASVSVVFSALPRERRPVRLLLWLMALVLGSVVVRNVAFALIVMAFCSAEGVCGARSALSGRVPSRAVVSVALAVVVGVYAMAAWERDYDTVVGPRAGWYPMQAAEFVTSRSLETPVFNDWDSGAYLNWAWGGAIRTFIDGRALGGAGHLQDYRDTIEARRAQAVLDSHDIRTVVMQVSYRNSGRTFPLVGWLLRHPDWVLVDSEDALVFTRGALPADVAVLPDASAWRYVLRHLGALERVNDQMSHVGYSKGVAYFHLGEWGRARAAFEEARSRYPDVAPRYAAYVRSLHGGRPTAAAGRP